jgi:RNA polymerase sigma-70 factor (ECF subfamily)
MSLPLKHLQLPANDSELAAMAATGDSRALGELYYRHAGKLGLLALRLLGSKADAEDVVQDLFVGLPEALSRYRDEGKLEAWLRRATVNLALKRMRQARRRREESLPDSLPGDGPLSSDRLQTRRAVDQLPDKLRSVVILKLVEGYSHQEIGELLGISRGSSEVRLSRALARLREKLGGKND